ncbi:hypothetical protein [Nostoc sp. TCL240-02]|uniref:hypothetical protein n=1 Tax=Nostoc sp. TCL240-02 TaxID=2572090 RepID=UPI00157F938D|nr:hypothetical protein [Nostoc sp. TCL240-02]
MSENAQEQKQPSLRETAQLPLEERHKILEPFIVAIAEDFLNDPELTEFSVLDGEDWENENENIIHVEDIKNIRNHDAFLNGYTLEDEELYDDYINQKQST